MAGWGAVGKEQKFGGRGQRFWMAYPLVNIQKAIENGHLWLIYLVNMVIFHRYVSLPEVNPLESAEVFRKFCPKDQASEAFEWALILVGVVLVRAIQERLSQWGWMGTDSHWKNSMSHQNGHDDPRTYPLVN